MVRNRSGGVASGRFVRFVLAVDMQLHWRAPHPSKLVGRENIGKLDQQSGDSGGKIQFFEIFLISAISAGLVSIGGRGQLEAEAEMAADPDCCGLAAVVARTAAGAAGTNEAVSVAQVASASPDLVSKKSLFLR